MLSAKAFIEFLAARRSTVLKIGDFSRLVQVSVRMLRHYDRLGLLKPIHVDLDSGYRYYGVHQMARLNRILALKDLGLSLTQIAAMLDQPLSAEQQRGMLRLQQADLRQRVEREQARLARVEARLRLIVQEDSVSHDDVILKPVAAQTVIAAREAIDDPHSIPARCSALRALLIDALQSNAVKPSGAWFVVFHDKGLRDEALEIEVAVPIAAEQAARLSPDGRLATYELPAVDMVAAFVHHGSLAALEETYAAAWRWVEANGYQMAGPWPYREIYLSEPNDGGADTVIEVQLPVQPDDRLIAIQALAPELALDQVAALHERTRRVFVFAAQEAAGMRHPAISPAHLVLGLLRAGNGIAGQLLAELGVTLDAARLAVESGAGAAARPSATASTEPVRQILLAAIAQVRQRGGVDLSRAGVTTGDLLLAMLRAPSGVVQLLERLGVDPQRLDELLEQRIEAGEPGID
jgi:DNA-binding transcriptional MerR regulator